MGDLKEAQNLHCSFPLVVFSHYITFKIGIAAASEPTPLERGRFGECFPLEYVTLHCANDGRKECTCSLCSTAY